MAMSTTYQGDRVPTEFLLAIAVAKLGGEMKIDHLDVGEIIKDPEGLLQTFETNDPPGTVVKTNKRLSKRFEPLKILGERKPVPMILFCPKCGHQHVDAGGFEKIPHRTHACEKCNYFWRPADVDTVGVAEINTQGESDDIPIRNYAASAARPERFNSATMTGGATKAEDPVVDPASLRLFDPNLHYVVDEKGHLLLTIDLQGRAKVPPGITLDGDGYLVAGVKKPVPATVDIDTNAREFNAGGHRFNITVRPNFSQQGLIMTLIGGYAVFALAGVLALLLR